MDMEEVRRTLGNKAKFIATPPKSIVRFWGHPIGAPTGRITEVRPELNGFIGLEMHETGKWLLGHDPETGQQVMVHLLDDVEWISVDRHPDSIRNQGTVA